MRGIADQLGARFAPARSGRSRADLSPRTATAAARSAT